MTSRRSNIKSKQEVLEILRDKILFLDLKPGETILDTELARELDVSRTPVREALLILQQENFVTIYPQSGTFVSLLDMEFLREVAYMRHIVECDVLDQLAQQGISVRNQVEQYIYLQEHAIRTHDIREYVKNDQLFHRNLFAVCNHSRIWTLLEQQYRHVNRFQMLYFSESDKFLEKSIYEHKEILQFIEDGNISDLKTLLNEHHNCVQEHSATIPDKYESYFRERI